MHFTYCDPNSDPNKHIDLSQGDILERTAEIDALLKEYHPYYELNDNNKYFIVLTQTCDLVRGRADPCKSKYISISPVRPLSLVIEKQIESLKDKRFDFEKPVCTDKTRNQVNSFLERLFNNNETEYFYLHEDKSLKFPGSCCAFLRLSISIKAKENYETCMNARILGLNESFRDSLGWALGQIYSRVGTQDWEKKELQKMIKNNLSKAAIWVSDKNLKALQKDISGWDEDYPGEELNEDALDKMIKSIKTKKQSVLDIIDKELNDSPKIADLITNGTLDHSDLKKIMRRLRSHAQLTSLLK